MSVNCLFSGLFGILGHLNKKGGLRRLMNKSDPRPLFLTGYAKSGTTLLLSLLDGHPELCVFPKESEFFTVARAQIELDRDEGVKRFFERSILGAQFGMIDRVQVHVEKEMYFHALEKRWRSYDFKISAFLGAAVLAYGDVSGQTGRKWWVEKTPLTEQYGQLLSRWYPGMRMIYVVRDPRANYSSMKYWREREGSFITIPRFAHEWEVSVLQNERNRDFCRTLTLRYEDLVTDTVNCMKQICRFLEISYHKCLLSPTLGGRRFGGNSVYGDKFNGVSRSSLEKWRKILSDKDVRQIQCLLGLWMRNYGYKFKNTGDEVKWMSRDIIWAYMLKYVYDFYGKFPESVKRLYRRIPAFAIKNILQGNR